jgi:predicted AAA+ superfamily ATPase
MDSLKQRSDWLINNINPPITRYLMGRVEWDWRLIGVIGARGTGKTTLLLQHLKVTFGISETAIYITLDDLHFANNTLIDFIERFRQLGGKAVYIDEVHKYPGWAREIKNIYDLYPDMKIVFTGSSVIEILKQDVDLSRRAVMYTLQGLSFREYLNLVSGETFDVLQFNDLLTKHTELSMSICSKIKPLAFWDEYLKTGYYPYFNENKNVYYIRLEQAINLTLETDLNFIDGFDAKNIPKIKQLLYVLAMSVPFKPNIVKLSEKIGIHRNTLINYLHYLEKSQIIQTLFNAGVTPGILQKPDKIYLENTNISWLLSETIPDKGTLRETFFLNQLKNGHTIKLPVEGDYLVDDKWIFEVGGKGKTNKQIKDVKNSYIVSDDIETGAFNRIPLWLFGMLY